MAIKVVFEEAVASHNFSYKPGRTVTLSDDNEAFRFVRKGIATLTDDAASQKAYDAWLKTTVAAEAAAVAAKAVAKSVLK